ncbi:hypothetical protein PPROV_000174300 [Pycnococcus provasolii]|uniref:Uncharacterized protein n=1 Tax=Pycnococcus provasolii TaxID=41880 RepID=A0A830H8H3_9CHLO|nr:hypothetical protein PPROV_000174300 [Pycnococcus provasolii]
MPLFLVGWQHAPSTVTLIRANHPKHLAKIITSCGFDANTCVWTEYQGPLFLNFNAHARRIHVQPTHNTDADEEGNVPPNTTSVMKEGADGLFRPIPGSIPAEEFPASPGADGGRLAQSLRGKAANHAASQDGALAPVDDVGAAATSAENEDGALAPVDDAPAPEAPPPAALEEAVEEEKGAAKPSIDPAGAEDLLDAELENELLARV